MDIRQLKNILGITILVISLSFVYVSLKGGQAIFFFSVLVSSPFIIIGVFLASDALLAPILNFVSRILYGEVSTSKIEYPLVDGYIVRHQYQEALEALNTIIEKDPLEPVAQLKRCELLADHLQRPQEALELAYFRLKQKELGAEDVKLAFLTHDLLVSSGHHRQAQEIISSCIEKITDPLAIKAFEQRSNKLSR